MSLNTASAREWQESGPGHNLTQVTAERVGSLTGGRRGQVHIVVSAFDVEQPHQTLHLGLALNVNTARQPQHSEYRSGSQVKQPASERCTWLLGRNVCTSRSSMMRGSISATKTEQKRRGQRREVRALAAGKESDGTHHPA